MLELFSCTYYAHIIYVCDTYSMACGSIRMEVCTIMGEKAGCGDNHILLLQVA